LTTWNYMIQRQVSSIELICAVLTAVLVSQEHISLSKSGSLS